MRLDRLLASLVVVAASALCGCTATMKELITDEDFTPRSEALRNAKFSADASTLSYEEGLKQSEDNKVWKKLRRENLEATRKGIAEGLTELAGGGEGKPARYRLTVEEADSSWVLFFVPCFVLLSPFGCPTGFESAKVKLEVEVDGRTVEATGEGGRVLFYYSTENTDHSASWAEVAIAEATVEALRDIDAQLSGAPAQAAGREAPRTTNVASREQP